MAPVMVARGKWEKEYVDPVAEAKLERCYELDIDVYFDDDPAIVRRMRELNAEDMEKGKRKVVALKYGPWIDEFY